MRAMVATVDVYNVLKFLHIMAAVVWVGGAILLQAMAQFALKSNLSGRAAEFAGEVEVIGKRFFTPLSVVVLVLGIGLVQQGDWGFGKPWVILGMLGIVATIATGAGYLGPQMGKLAKVIEAEGADAPSVRTKMKTILNVARIDIVVLVVIIFVMVTKVGQ
ncbi:MAG: DUF2269 family protein [Acidimicrobiales bacterium]